MPFFQNPFSDEYQGNWLLGDRHHMPTFVVPVNAGRGRDLVVSWTNGPFDLSGNDADGNPTNILKLSFALHNTKNWATISVNISSGAASAAAVTEAEVIAALNANASFSSWFTASFANFYIDNKTPRIHIRQRKSVTEFKFYVVNGQADEKLGFNARAGVAELPTYFARHTIANRFVFEDSAGMIIELDPGANDVDAAIIDGAVDAKGVSLEFDSSTIQDDYQLLEGRSGIFTFTKGPSNNAVSTTETIIEYPAGAKVGDLAKKTITRKDSGALVVSKFELPYTLESGDLITPP